jgi:stalled ribosome rescue protein Dom34
MNLPDIPALPHHTVVWMDHREAHIISFDLEREVESRVHAHHTPAHLHHKANTRGSDQAPVDQTFLKDIVEAVKHSGYILLTGPANAKNEWCKFAESHYPQVFQKIVGIEALDHPSDGQLVAVARKFMRASDRMHSQTDPHPL